MRFAVDIPDFAEFADPRVVAEVAREAEEAGWDAIWIWDHIMRSPGDPHADPWLLLAVVAMSTTRVRLGPMVVPLARRRPTDLARQAVTLDYLSAGRLTLGVGSGSRTGAVEGCTERVDGPSRREPVLPAVPRTRELRAIAGAMGPAGRSHGTFARHGPSRSGASGRRGTGQSARDSRRRGITRKRAGPCPLC